MRIRQKLIHTAVTICTCGIVAFAQQTTPTPTVTPPPPAAQTPPAAETYVLVPASDLAKLTAAAAGKEKPAEGPWPAIFNLLAQLAWPAAILILAWRLLKSPQIEVLVTKLSRRVTQLSVAGLEIQLSEGAVATINDIHKLVAQIPDTHQEWVANTHLEPQFHKVIDDIRDYLCMANPTYSQPLDLDDFKGFRFTLHVPDVILSHSLRQLVDYVGKDRGKSGRIFSARRGLLGLSWRLEKSRHDTHQYTEDELVEKWGMTRSEAKDTTHNKGMLLTFIISSDQKLPLAILFADADKSEFLGTKYCGSKTPAEAFTALEKIVLDSCTAHGLTVSLQKLEKARVKVKQADLYSPVRTS